MLQELEAEQQVKARGQATPGARPGELDLFGFLLLLRGNLLRLVVFAVLGFLLMVAYSFHVKPRYASTATILIPQKGAASSNLIAQVNGAGLDLLGGGYEVYVDILRSHAVADPMIAEYHLQQHYGTPTLEYTELALAGATTMAVAKEGMLTVSVNDSDPKMAATLANGYFVQLERLNHSLAMTSAGQQRLYYEQQMIHEKNALADAEVALEQTQEKTGNYVPNAQAQANLSAVEQTRAEIRSKQIDLDAMEQGATAENPQVIRLKSEISGLQSQLGGLAGGGGSGIQKIPQQSLEYVRASREVKFHETLFDILSRQYEGAKEQESKDVTVIQVLDPAVPAGHKSWPPRTAYALSGLVAGALLSVVYTLLSAFVRAILNNPDNRARAAVFLSGRRSATPATSAGRQAR